MNILFLTISRIDDISERGIYTDLMRKFRDNGHNVFIATPAERRYKLHTELTEQKGIQILKVQTLNFQKTNIVEKGIGTLLIEYQFLVAVKKYFHGIKFDLVLYSTPPITFTKVVKYIKRNQYAKSYLLLKDIFPQNAVDLMLMKRKGLIHRFFMLKERKLYAISDFIGCMSMANVVYICIHNPAIKPGIVHVNPNSIEPGNVLLTKTEKTEIRNKFGIPINKTIFVYGGNLGKPQGVDFLIKVIESNIDCENAFFVIVGSGTEFNKIDKWFKLNQPQHALLLTSLPKDEYDKLVQACDIGMIFLDRRFTIPNYPSRLLSYLEYKMPVITATDSSSDIGRDAESNGYGFYCENGNIETFNRQIKLFTENKKLTHTMGEKGYQYLLDNFTVENSYSIIINHLN